MGNEASKPTEKLRDIDREVKSLRSSIRSSRKNISKGQQEQIVHNLAKFSNDANALRGRIKERYIDDIQRNISYVMNEVLMLPPNQDLDQGAVETNSIIQMPVNKRQSTSRNSTIIPAKKSKNNENNLIKQTVPTIDDIELKLKTLEPQIATAIKNRDNTLLRVHKETVKVLATDLEMTNLEEATPLWEKKEKLINTVTIQYQKINKAMKDIKRTKDLNYLADLKQKEQSSKVLDDIRKSIEGTDLLLKNALKNDDINGVQSAQKNLEEINHKLQTAEAVDEDTRNLKLQMVDKVNWLYNYISDSTKKGSQSDLTKAQSSYEDIIKTIASGKNKDQTDIKVKLESLQNFVENIREDKENSLKRKTQLLNNINSSFALIETKEKDKQKHDTTDQLDKTDKYLNQVESLFDAWKSLQNSLNAVKICTEDLKKIDEILAEIQNAIVNTRNSFRKSNTKLQTKLNYSTPNLASVPQLDRKFASSLSIGASTNMPMKLRAKVYNLNTPEIKNISDQVILKHQNPDRNAFSKIEEIKTQVYYIKEKFDESQHKQHLKNKLDSYVQILEGYTNLQNQAISNNARIVLIDIQEMLKKLPVAQNDVNQERTSIEDCFENVVSIQENIDALAKAVDSFTGLSNGDTYVKTKHKLLENKNYLLALQLPPKYDMINQQKIEILKRIHFLLDTLDKKANNTYVEDAIVVDTKRSLENLKQKVSRFSGAYKGVMYNKIEKDLNKLLLETSEKIDNKQISDDIVKETEKYLKILEHRATRDQSFRQPTRNPTNDDQESFCKLKQELQNTKAAIDTTPTNDINIFLGLKSRLDLVKLGLDQLRCLNESDYHQKDILYTEVDTLKNFVDAKIALNQQSLKQYSFQDDKTKSFENQLNQIEEAIKRLTPEIQNFVGTTSDNKFYELDEKSLRLILKMDVMEFPKNSQLHIRKQSLLKEISEFGEILSLRARETETIIQYERDIDDIETNIEKYAKSTKDLEKVADKINQLKTNLETQKFNPLLRDRKNSCVEKIDNVVSKIVTTNPGSELSNKISKLEQELKSIIKEVDRYSGTHADKRYTELDNTISGLFFQLKNLDVPHASDLFKKQSFLLKEMQSYSRILDKRATETEVYRHVRKRIDASKLKLETFSGTKQELKAIEAETSSIEAQINIADIREETKQELKQRLVGLLAKLGLIQQKLDPDKGKDSRSKHFQSYTEYYEVKLDEMERELEDVRQKIMSFNDVEGSEDYQLLEDSLLKLTASIKKLDIPKENRCNSKKLELRKRAVDCLTLLDDRVQNIESIVDIEKELEMVREKVDVPLSEQERNNLDEKLISLQVKLSKLCVNEDLRDRKSLCSNTAFMYMKQLKNRVETSDEDNTGTSV